jgi:hypothetical protein
VTVRHQTVRSTSRTLAAVVAFLALALITATDAGSQEDAGPTGAAAGVTADLAEASLDGVPGVECPPDDEASMTDLYERFEGTQEPPGGIIVGLVEVSCRVDEGDLHARASASDIRIDAEDHEVSVPEAEMVAAECAVTAGGVEGHATLAGFTINREPVEVTGEPNQEISDGRLTVILNHQVTDPVSGALTVHGAHVEIDDGHIQLASVTCQPADAQVTPPPAPPAPPVVEEPTFTG